MFNELWRRFEFLLHRKRFEQDLAEEMRLHLWLRILGAVGARGVYSAGASAPEVGFSRDLPGNAARQVESGR